MYGVDDTILQGWLVGTLLDLVDRYKEIKLSSGPVKRIFEDERHLDVLLEFTDGKVDYAKYTDVEKLDTVVREYKAEYPNEFKEYMDTKKA